MKFRDTLIIIQFILEVLKTSAEIKLHPPWLQVIQYVNENYSVKCEGEGEKIWKNPSGQIITTGSLVYTLKKPPENVLYLKFNKIQKELKGFYNCSTTIKGKKFTKGFELIVIKPASFANTSTELIVHEGSDVVLDCFPDGEPTPEISWYFEDKEINEWFPSTNYRNTTRGLSLKISNTSWRDSGTYTCRAFQKLLQTRDAEQVYWLKVRHAPYANRTEEIFYGFKNESRNITCQVLAYPTAYFIWYRNNIPIDPKKSNVKIYNDENISIMETLLNEATVGKYNCEAANPLGILQLTIEVKLLEKPETPKILVHNVSHTSVVISVQPYPSHEFECIMYYTEYTYCSYEEKWKTAEKNYCRNKRIPNTNKTHCTIKNLKSLTKYAVRAVIINPGGSSNSSEELLFRTRVSAATIKIKSYIIFFVPFCLLLF